MIGFHPHEFLSQDGRLFYGTSDGPKTIAGAIHSADHYASTSGSTQRHIKWPRVVQPVPPC